MARLTDLKAQVIGISVNDPFSNKAFAEKNRLPFPVLSDYKREVIKSYGLELPELRWTQQVTRLRNAQSSFLDPKAWCEYVWVSDDPSVEPNYQEIQKALEEIM